ncbi:MAG: hypothetical protein JO033_00290 [Acidobacteriaceae bacterium]|nr:hypothetical protein [Acidobacteriaceae bacterium]MBV9501484.1 hypothetical protein [Acidobacteriaceae bacterium]
MAAVEREISSLEEQHSEVEAVVSAFARSPLMARLFSYICEKHFAGKADELNEIKIAADVFNRVDTFDRTRDSIARVEVHRLRKKLKQYYESEGKDHAWQIEISPGSYAPVFRYTAKTEQDTSETAGTDTAVAEATEALQKVEVASSIFSGEILALPTAPVKPRRRGKYVAVALSVLALCLLTVAYFGFLRRHRNGPPAEGTPDRSRAAVVQETVPAAAGGPIRFLCGYNGPPHIGRLGDVWGPDQYFHGGRPWPTRPGFVRRASDPFLFRNMRTGEFSYDIPVKPATYELHLYFIETEYGEDLGGGENSRTFMIRLNGATLIQTFDPLSDAGGPRIADERVFKDVQPAADGKLHISFESQRGEPMISGIVLLPGTPHHQIPIRIATQINSYTDHLGHIWMPDDYYLGGVNEGGKPPVTGTPDPTLFGTERMGNFSYAIPTDPRSTYTANLYFAETYFGPGASGMGGIGSRVFNVSCNGSMLLDHLDIFREAGTLHAMTKSFHRLRPNAQGKLILSFRPVANYASVFGIEVLDESK